MQSSFICSYIISYTHSQKNLKILKENLNQIMRDPRIQIIIVEMGNNSNLEDQDIRSKHVFLKTHVYNVGWAFNCGHRYATTDHLFFGDFKYLPNLELIHSILNDSSNRHCVYLQNSIGKMSKEQTENRQQQMNVKKVDSESTGIIYYSKDGIISVGGWDENVIGDDLYKLQNIRNTSMLNIAKVDNNTTIEFYVDTIPLNKELLEYSNKHLDKVSKLDKNKINNYSISQSKKIANSRKYEKIELMIP